MFFTRYNLPLGLLPDLHAAQPSSQAAVEEGPLSGWSCCDFPAQRAFVCLESLLIDSLHFIETADQRDFSDSAAFLRGSPFMEGLTMSPEFVAVEGMPLGVNCTAKPKTLN